MIPTDGSPSLADDGHRALRETLERNGMLVEVLRRAATLDLPGWYLTAGCLFQGTPGITG